MPRTTGEILASFYSGSAISDEDKQVLVAKAGERINAFDAKMYQHIGRMRSKQPGVLFKSGAAALLHPIQNVTVAKLRDDDS